MSMNLRGWLGQHSGLYESVNLNQVVALQEHEREEQQHQSKTYSWLKTGHPLGYAPKPVDRYALILAAGAPLWRDEMTYRRESEGLVYFSAVIKQITAAVKQTKTHPFPISFARDSLDKLKELQSLMKQAYDISYSIDRTILKSEPWKERGSRQSYLDDLSRDLLKILKEKKRIWLPLQWKNKGGDPYALLADIDSVNKCVTLYTAGSSTAGDWRPMAERFVVNSKVDTDELLSQQAILFHNVNIERVEHPTFFKLLCELSCRSAWGKKFSADDSTILQPLESYLQSAGEPLHDKESEPAFYKKTGRSLLPLTKAITAAVYYTVGRDDYKKLKFLWQSQALVSYNMLPQEPFDDLVGDIVDNIDRSVAKITLPQEFLRGWEATATDIRNLLDAQTDSVTASGAASKPITLPLPIKSNDNYFFSIDDERPLLEDSRNWKRAVERSTTYGGVLLRCQALSSPPQAADSHAIAPFVASLRAIVDSCPAVNAPLNNLYFNAIADVVLALPNPIDSNDSYWKKVPKADIEACMKNIYAVMRKIVDLCEEACEVENDLILNKLFAINVQLATHRHPDLLNGFQYNPPGLNRCVNEPHLIVQPKYQQQLKNLLTFFYPTFKMSKRLPWFISLFEQINNSTLYNIEYSFYKDEQLDNRLRTLLVRVLEQALAIPEKKEAFFNKTTYTFYDPCKVETLKLKEEDPLPLKLICLMSEPIDERAVMPPAIHMLLQSYLLHHVKRERKKGIFAHHPHHIALQATCSRWTDGTTFYHVGVFQSEKKKFHLPLDYSIVKYPISRENTIDTMHGNPDVNAVIYGDRSILQQPLDVSRELRLIGADPYDTAARTFAAMKKYAALLPNSQFQEVIEHHLFRYGRLPSQLFDNAKVIAEGASILEHLIDHYIHLNDGKTCLFLSKIALTLTHFTRSSAINAATTSDALRRVAGALPDFRAIVLQKVRPRFEKNDHIVRKCFHTLVEYHWQIMSGNRDAEEEGRQYVVNNIIDIARDLYLYLFYEKVTCVEKSSLARQVKYFILPTFIATIERNGNLRNLIPNLLLWKMAPCHPQKEWSGKYPYFSSDSHLSASLLIDLDALTIKESGASLFTTLPRAILRDPAFQIVFPGKVRSCSADADNTILTLNGGLDDELKVDKMRWRYLRSFNSRQECLRNDRQESLRNGRQECLRYEYIKTPSIYYWRRFNNPKVQCWLERSSDDNGKSILHFFLEGKKEIGRAYCLQDEDNQAIFHHQKFEGEKNKILIRKPFLSTTITAMEGDKERDRDAYIELWADKEGRSCELHLLSSHLSFHGRKVDGRMRLFSTFFKGYFLVENIKGPAAMQPFLTLQNDRGEHKILYKHKPDGVIAFDFHDGELTCRSLLGQLTLLLLWIESKNYAMAMRQLRQINPIYNIAEKEGCSPTLNSAIKTLLALEKHPSANALLLHLVALREKNGIRYSGSGTKEFSLKEVSLGSLSLGNEEAELFAERYLDVYCQNRNNIAGFLLTDEQERLLIEYFLRNKQGHYLDKRISRYRRQKPNLGRHTLLPYHSQDETKKEIDWCHESLVSSASRHSWECHLDKALLKSQRFFIKHFHALYNYALKKNDNLGRLLDINSPNMASSPHYQCIKAVFDTPDAFPKAKERIVGNDDRKEWEAVVYQLEKKFATKMGAIAKTAAFANSALKGWCQTTAYTQWSLFDFTLSQGKKVDTSKKVFTPSPTAAVKAVFPLLAIDRSYDKQFESLFDKFFTIKEEAQQVVCEGLPPNHADRNIARRLQQENEELCYYRKKMPKQLSFHLKGRKTLAKLKKALQAMSRKQVPLLARAKSALIWLQHREKTTTAWYLLKKATMTKSSEAIAANLTTEPQVKKAVSEYLVHATRLQQIHNAITAIERVEKKEAVAFDSIAKALLLKRAYMPSVEQLHLLWFEHANGFLYRSDQLDKVTEITPQGCKRVLAEMPTGFGKSKAVVATVDNLKASTEDFLIFNCWPATLELTCALDLKDNIWESYGQQVDRIVFNRTTPITARTLSYLYQDMVSNLKKGRPVNIKAEALRALELHMLLFLFDEEGHEETLPLMLEILGLIRKKGFCTIDEAHLVLDVLDKLIYTLGTPAPLPVEHVLLMQDFCEYLIEGEVAPLLAIRDNKQREISKEKETLVEKVIPKLVGYFQKKFNDFSDEFADFLLGSDDKAIPKRIASSPQRGCMALAKGLLTRLLMPCLKGAVDEKYGLSLLHIDKVEYAIPFAMANTPKETSDNPTQYKNPHETLLKTYFTYLHKGLSLSQLKKMIDTLKEQAFDQAVDGLALSATKASLFFNALVGSDKYFLCGLSGDELKEVWQLLRCDKKTIFHYLLTYVTPQIKVYPQTIVSTAHNFLSMFASSLSQTATPQAARAHSFDTFFVPMKGTSGQVTHLFLTKSNDLNSLHPLSGTTPQEAFDEAQSIISGNPRIKAIADIGAYFKGLSNKSVAAKMLLDNAQIEAVIFFDETDGLFKVVDRAADGEVLQILSESDVDAEEAHVYFDQSRCFGSDIKQAIDAVALLMTNSMTTKSEAGQAAGRMRGWSEQQNVEIGFPGTLNCNIKELLVHWIVNGVRQEEFKNYLNVISQIDNERRRQVLDKMIEAKSDISKVRTIANKYRPELLSEDTADPWLLYAICPREVATKPHIERYAAAKDFNLDPPILKELLLSDTVQTHQVGVGLECEVLLELNVEQEEEKQIATDDKKPKREKCRWDNSLNLFKKGWEKPHATFAADRVRKLALQTLPRKAKAELPQVFGTIAATAVSGLLLTGTAYFVNNVALKAACSTAGIALCGAAWQSFKWSQRAYDLRAELRAPFKLFTPEEGLRNHGRSSLFSSEDYLGRHLPSAVAAGAALFGDNILVSTNLYPVIGTRTESEGWFSSKKYLEYRPQVPFQSEQKPLFSVLVIRDQEGSETPPSFTFILIDQNDSIFFHENLQNDLSKSTAEEASRRRRQVGLYDLAHNMFTLAGKNGFSNSDIDHPEFWTLVGKAKFLNGQITFESKEEEHFGSFLDAMIAKIGAKPIRDLYLDQILSNRPRSRKSLLESKEERWIARKLQLQRTQEA